MSDLTAQITSPLEKDWPDDLLKRAEQIKLVALDVDGIMSDGKLYFSANGDELKAFNILDGLGLKQIMAAGITVAVITGRSSPLTQKRMTDLGIPHLMQGREDKKAALQELVSTLGIQPEAIAYMGDDLPDLPAIRYAGLGVTVPNGYWLVKNYADYCTKVGGGRGAVRELCDLLLTAGDHLEATLTPYLEP